MNPRISKLLGNVRFQVNDVKGNKNTRTLIAEINNINKVLTDSEHTIIKNHLTKNQAELLKKHDCTELVIRPCNAT